jgi:MFS family permease
MTKQAPQKKIQKDRRRSLFSIAIARIIDFGEGGALSSLFPVISKALALNVGHLGTITSVKRIFGAIFAPLWGLIADRYSRKVVLVWGTGIWGLWTLMIGFVQNYQQILILSVISGIGLAAVQSPLNSLISDLFKEEERGKAFGVFRSISFVGTVIAILLFGYLAEASESGWRIAFWLFGGLSVLSGLLIWLFVEEPARGSTEAAVVAAGTQAAGEGTFELRLVSDIFKTPTMLVMLLEIIPSTFVVTVAVLFIVTWLAEDRGFAPGEATTTFVMLVVGLALGGVGGGLIGDWADRINDRSGRLIVAHVSLILAALVAYLLFQVPWDGTIAYWVLIFLLGLLIEIPFSSAMAPVTSAVLLPEIRTTGFAIVQTVNDIGGALAAYVIGQLGVKLGLTGAFLWTVNLATVINVFLWFAFYRTYHRDADKVQQTLAKRVSQG